MFSAVVRTGEEFADPDVVSCYVHRPPYPQALYERLVSLAVGSGRLLDIGCGPGKLALGLAGSFQRVTAVDPSRAMLDAARDLGRDCRNIEWIESRVEEAELSGSYDLAVAGAAIHWMSPEIVMPSLAAALRPGACLAIISGDAPSDAPWIKLYRDHVIGWVQRGGATWRDPETTRQPYLNWLDVEGDETFTSEVSQNLEDLIEAEHSRATWSRSTMGDAANQFDDELRSLLRPYADAGVVIYRIETRLTFGRPRTIPGNVRP
jgi:SAM-dependent methyltransferase